MIKADIEREEHHILYPDFDYGSKKRNQKQAVIPRPSAPRKARKAPRAPTRKPYSRPTRVVKPLRVVDEDYDEIQSDSSDDVPLGGLRSVNDMEVDELESDTFDTPSYRPPSSLSTDAVPIPRVFSHLRTSSRSSHVTIEHRRGGRATNNSASVSMDVTFEERSGALVEKQVCLPITVAVLLLTISLASTQGSIPSLLSLLAILSSSRPFRPDR